RSESNDPIHFRRRLCHGGERRHEEGKDEGDDERDGAAPHGGVLPYTHAYSPWVSRGAYALGNPGEIRLVALEETADGVYQHSVGSSGVETAGFFERQDPFDPAVAFRTRCPQRPLPPQDAKP